MESCPPQASPLGELLAPPLNWQKGPGYLLSWSWRHDSSPDIEHPRIQFQYTAMLGLREASFALFHALQEDPQFPSGVWFFVPMGGPLVVLPEVPYQEIDLLVHGHGPGGMTLCLDIEHSGIQFQ